MMWPYVVLGILLSIIRSFLLTNDVNALFIGIIDIVDCICYAILEYKFIDRYVKIKFFENKKRLKILIVCQFVLLGILNVIGQSMTERGVYIG